DRSATAFSASAESADRHILLWQRARNRADPAGRGHCAITYQDALFGTPGGVMDEAASFSVKAAPGFSRQQSPRMSEPGNMNKTVNAGPAVWKKIDSFAGNTTSPVLTLWRPCPVCGAFEWRTLLRFDD